MCGDVASDVRYALRGWVRQPGFVLIAVLSLGCGIGLNTAVFSIINAIFLQGIRGVPAASRVVTIGERVPFATVAAVRDTVSGLDGAAAWQPISADIHAGDTIRRGAVPVVSDNYFATLGVVARPGPLLHRRRRGGCPCRPTRWCSITSSGCSRWAAVLTFSARRSSSTACP